MKNFLSRLLGRSFALAGLILLAGFGGNVARAQDGTRLILSPLEFGDFPNVTAYMDIRDAEGYFVSGIQAGDISVVEDGLELPATLVEEQRLGAQIVVAVNLGTAYTIVDEQGFSRFDYVKSGIDSWILRMGPSNIDDLSIVTQTGAPISHTMKADEWVAIWRTYEPILEDSTPNLDVLARAIEKAAEPTPNVGMGRAILFLTPTLEPDSIEPLQSLADQAAQLNIRVHVWMIDSKAYFNTSQSVPLRSLAAQTGGQFIAFSGTEFLPDLDLMMESDRRVYAMTYQSRVNQSGAHEIFMRAGGNAGGAVSDLSLFTLEIAAPNPFFVAPPPLLARSLPETAKLDEVNFEPKEWPLDIIIEFPDGLEREIVRTTLFVNGEKADENLVAPFDGFTLDISQYFEDDRVFIHVEIEDEIGLVGRSIDTPIQIIVNQPQRNFISLVTRYLTEFTFGVLIVLGVAVFLVLVLAGRLRPQTVAERSKMQSNVDIDDPLVQPPLSVTQNLEGQNDDEPAGPSFEQERGRTNWLARRFGINPFRAEQLTVPEQPDVFLEPISLTGETVAGEVLSIKQRESVIGSNKAIASLLIDDGGVEDRHARLWQDDDGVFHVADEETLAGTWVNYAQVTGGDKILLDGDIVHFGQCGYRFSVQQTPDPREIVVHEVIENGEEL